MCVLEIYSKMIGMQVSIKAKGTQDCFPVDFKHCASIFQEKTDQLDWIVHLQQP